MFRLMHRPRLFRMAAVLAAGAAAWLQPAYATPSLVVDLETGQVIHAEDAGHPWYPASTAKLMTALVTFQALERGDVDPETPVILSRNAIRQKAVYAGLKTGSAMTLNDALYAVLVSSANEVAVALAETVGGSEKAFVARMNDEARRLGLTATHFTNPNGLFDPAQTVSARDLAVLSRELYQRYPQYHEVFRTASVTINGKDLPSYNELLTRYPGTLGLKTGFVCQAGRNIVALAERDGRRLLAVVLGATTGRERSERAAKLLDEAFSGKTGMGGTVLADLANSPQLKPEDMRMRLCSDQTAVYEAKQDKLYPWGLPGENSYLTAPVAAPAHTIQTWFVPQPEFVPVPAAKPVTASADDVSITSIKDLIEAAPPEKPGVPNG